MRTSDLPIVRSAVTPVSVLPPTEQRAEGDAPAGLNANGMPTMYVEFSRFDTWYEIDSYWEGRFLERTARGSFAKTIAERASQVKVFFNHGADWQIDQKVLGVPSLLEERETSPYAEVPLLATSYNRDLVEGLEAGAYGSSFMFNVLREEWVEEPGESEHNPRGLPERTITEVRLLEFGPVTWPANPEATAGLRACGTDHFADKLRARSPERYQAFTERFIDFRAAHGLRTPAEDAARDAGTSDTGAATTIPEAPDTTDDVVHHPTGLSTHARTRLLAASFLSRSTQ